MSREQQTKCPQCGSFQRPTPLTAFDAPLVTCGHSWHLVEPTPPAMPQPETPDRVKWLVNEMLNLYGITFTDATSREVCVDSWALQFTRALSPPPDVERLFLVIDQPDHDWSHTATVVGIFRAERDAWVAAGKRGRTGRVYPVTVDAQVKYGDINALFSPSTPGEGQP